MVPGTRLVMLGKQGAGKGTQCVRLSRHYVVPHISTGDMLRGAVRSRSELGQRARAFIDSGELIPDSVVIGLVAERLSHTDTQSRGFVLDGFPRTVAQAEALDELLMPRGLEIVINLVVDTEIVLKRLANRRVCDDCGANYSVEKPPRVEWVCDICGGEVVQREDDTEAAIRRRLELYEHETAPLIAWYEAQGILVHVDGTGGPDEVAMRSVRVVDEAHQRGLVDTARRGGALDGPPEALVARARAGDDGGGIIGAAGASSPASSAAPRPASRSASSAASTSTEGNPAW